MTSARTRVVAPEILAIGAVAIVACVPYLSTLHDYFVQDDFGVVQLMARRSWTMFFRWFTMPWTEDIWMYTPDEIRPFVALSYVMTASWGAADPTAHHVLNIAIHAANGMLVMAIARRVAGLGVMAAAFAAAIFVVLPVQAESVAWITGRVDSLPALAYLAAFLEYARWRSGRSYAYWWAIAWFFVALFSKQNTIVMTAALIAYDLLILRKPFVKEWRWLRPYVPFMLLTVGYLALRYAVTGTVVRERELTAEQLRLFGGVVLRHTERILVGHPATHPGDWLTAAILVGVVAVVVMIDAWHRRRVAPAVLFFGVVWPLLGIAPSLVAGYESPRHVYLASVGWAILLGLALDAALARVRDVRFRPVICFCAAAIMVFYVVQLRLAVEGWNRAAAISRTAVAHLQRESMAVPPGTLVVVGAPISSWEWAVPFMAQPPYTRTDLTKRILIITPWRLHCCRGQWLEYTRATLKQWSDRAAPTPVVALYFNPRTGAMSRLTEADYPDLRAIVRFLNRVETLDALDGAIVRMLDQLVARRPVASAPAVR